MKLFAIHAPRAAEAIGDLEGARAAKTGFSSAALVFGPLWLLARGLWAALAVYVILGGGDPRAGGLRLARRRRGGRRSIFLGHLYLGVEGRALAIAARDRARPRARRRRLRPQRAGGREGLSRTRRCIRRPGGARRGAPAGLARRDRPVPGARPMKVRDRRLRFRQSALRPQSLRARRARGRRRGRGAGDGRPGLRARAPTASCCPASAPSPIAGAASTPRPA